jgi:hypothetical protein
LADDFADVAELKKRIQARAQIYLVVVWIASTVSWVFYSSPIIAAWVSVNEASFSGECARLVSEIQGYGFPEQERPKHA